MHGLHLAAGGWLGEATLSILLLKRPVELEHMAVNRSAAEAQLGRPSRA